MLHALPPSCRSWRPPQFDKPYSHRVREISHYLHLNLPLGVTNERREAIKLISSAIGGDSSLQDRGVHNIFYLCFLVLLIYLSVFSCVSYSKNTKKKLVTLL